MLPGLGREQTFSRLVCTISFWVTEFANTKEHPAVCSMALAKCCSLPQGHHDQLLGSQEYGLESGRPQVGLTPLLSIAAPPPLIQVSVWEAPKSRITAHEKGADEGMEWGSGEAAQEGL